MSESGPDEEGRVERVGPSRLTVVLAIAAIVAVIGMLVAGVLLAPSGDDGDADEASLVQPIGS